MIDRIGTTRFLAVLGASGTGKSSLVKTGLLDGVDLGLLAAAGSAWRVADFKPGGAPLKNLARRLLETEVAGAVPESDTELLRAFLLCGPRAIAEWCAEGHLPPPTNLLLLVDQFEELFRYQHYAGREEADAFAALLIESARQAHAPIYVALTIRSEYLGACALIEGLAEAISAGMFLVPRMTRDQCRSAIVRPSRVCGFAIDEPLVARLLNDLAAFAPWDNIDAGDQTQRLGRRADQLPLLQYCLNRMWGFAQGIARHEAVKLTLADYERIGGLGGALDAHANEILTAIGAEHRPLAERVFRALTEGKTVAEAVRRPIRFGDLVELCEGDEAGVRAVVDAFRAPGCNFLTPEPNSNDPQPLAAETIIDISHESLIRQWKQLSEWLEAEASAARQWHRLVDRFEDGQPLHGAELANMRAWRDEQKPSAAWAWRYGGDFAGVMKFIDDSERRRRRFAPLVLPLLALASLNFTIFWFAGVLAAVYGVFPKEGTLPYYLAAYAISGAITYGFGFWRYADISFSKAILYAVVSSVVYFGSTYGIVTTLGRSGADPLFVLRWWTATFSAPLGLAIAAIFVPLMRRLSIWLPLLIAADVPFCTLYWLYYNHRIATSDVTVEYLGYLIAIVWVGVLGFQLRRSATQSDWSKTQTGC